MGDNSFIPLTEFSKNTNGDQPEGISLSKVIKESKVHAAGEHPITNETQDQQSGINCIPNIVHGRVASIDVQCSCGHTTRITLEYGDEKA